MKRTMLPLAVLIILAAGCDSGGSARANSPPVSFNPSDTAVSHKVVSYGKQRDIKHQLVQVITTDTAYSDFVSMVPSMTGNVPNPSFLEESLIILVSPVICSDIEIIEFSRSESIPKLKLTVALSPAQDCAGSGESKWRRYMMIQAPQGAFPLSVTFAGDHYSPQF